MTPYQIEICLWYFRQVSDHPHAMGFPPAAPPIAPETFQGLIESGLLRAVDQTSNPEANAFEGTQKNNAYCMALQVVPLPVEQWVVTYPEEFAL